MKLFGAGDEAVTSGVIVLNEGRSSAPPHPPDAATPCGRVAGCSAGSNPGRFCETLVENGNRFPVSRAHIPSLTVL